jgi:hypothetical protein
MIPVAIGVVVGTLISALTTWHACRPPKVDRLAGPLFPAGPDSATSSVRLDFGRTIDATIILERLATERGDHMIPVGRRGVTHAIEAVPAAARARRIAVEHQHRIHRLTAPPRLRLVA